MNLHKVMTSYSRRINVVLSERPDE
uniref:ArsR family transcriptional regulator n=1 Tax=Heterorhabditis bacteriophora TaxID=37862 RepID=A0A1I7WIT8_HETBA